MSGAHPAPPRLRPSRRRRRFILLVAIGIATAAAAIAVQQWFLGWIEPALEHRLGVALGGTAHLGSLDLRFWRLEAHFTDLTLEIPAPGADPLRVAVASGTARLSWSGVPALAGGRIHLAELRLVAPVVESEERFWEARKRATDGPPIDLRIDVLEVQGGRFRYEDRETPADFHATAVELRAAWDDAVSGVTGGVSLRLALRRAPLADTMDLDLSGELTWRRHAVELRRLAVRSAGVELDMDGTLVLFGGLSFAGRGQASLDLDTLRSALEADFPEIGGEVSGPFGVELGPEPLQIHGRLAGRDLRFGPFESEAATFDLQIEPQRIALDGISAEAFDGWVKGGVDVRWAEPLRFDAALSVDEIPSTALLRWLDLPLPLDSRIDGSVAIGGEPSRPETWRGAGRFVATPITGGTGVAVGGAGELEIAAGRLEIRAPAAEVPGAELDVALAVGVGAARGSGGQIVLEGQTYDAGRTQRGTLRILGDLDLHLPAFAMEPLAGRGAVQARIGFGSGSGGTLDLSLDLEEGAWGRQPFDRAKSELSLSDGIVTLRGFELRHGAQAVDATALLALEPFAVRELDLRTAGLALPWILELLDLEIPVDGLLDAKIQVGSGGGSASGSLVLREATAFGEQLATVESRIEILPDEVRLDGLRVTGPLMELTGGSAVWRPREERLELVIGGAVLRLEELSRVRAAGAPVRGNLVLSGRILVRDGQVEGDLELLGDEGQVLDFAAGSSRGHLHLDSERATFDLAGEASFGWSLAGEVGWGADYPLRLQIRLDHARLAMVPAEREIWALVTARLDILGPLRRPEALTVSGEIESATLELGFEQLTLVAPAPLQWTGDHGDAGPIRLSGGGSELTARVRYDFAASEVDARLAGTADLGVLVAPFRQLSAAGPVAVDLRARGSLDRPRIEGTLVATDGRVRLGQLHQSLDNIAFRISLAQERVQVEEFGARSGNGEIGASGSAVIDGASIVSYEGEIRAANLRIDYPEGFRGVYEAQLRLQGNPDSAKLSGRIDVLRGLYDHNIGLDALVRQSSRKFRAPEASELPGDVELDLEVVSDDTLQVQNDLARLEAGLDLHVGGTLRTPQVTGRVVVIPGGQLNYRDVRYRIVSASVDFLDQETVDPYLTLRAETNVDEYTVFLRIEGTADRFEYELTSEPALSPSDIIALLTTGSRLASPQDAPLGGDVAANYFGGMVAQPVTRQLERFVGVDRIEFSPRVIEGEGDPTTRITVVEEIADDVSVVFSNDVGQTERQLYQINWDVTRKIRLKAQRDTRGGVGGDIGYFDRFWLGKRTPRVAESDPAAAGRPAAAPAGPRVAAIRIEGVTEGVKAELLPRIGIEPGDVFSRSAMFRGVENIRVYYVDRGRIQSRVHAFSEASDEGITIRFEVDPGPPTLVTYEGVSKKEGKEIGRQLGELWSRSVFHEELYEDAAELIRSFFQKRGYYAVDVSHEVKLKDGRPEVRFHVDRGKPVHVEAVVLHGVESIPESRVRGQLLTRPGGAFAKRPIVPSVLLDDVEAIRQLYREEGFLRVQVDPPHVRLSTEGASAQIDITIVEGPRFTIERVEVADVPGFPARELLALTAVEAGQVYVPSSAMRAESRLRAYFDERGYPDARVRTRVDVEDTAVVLRYEVDPGGSKRVGRIRLRGNQLTKDKIILRELAFEPGDPISHEKVLRSQQALYRLGLFRSVRISYGPLDDADPFEQWVEVALEETAPYVTSIAAGYDTEAGAHVHLSLANENFRGKDRILGLQTRYSDIERGIQLTGRDPRLFGEKLPALVSFGWEDRDEEKFSFERSSAALRVDRRLGAKWSAYVRYSFQNIIVTKVEDPQELEEEKLEDVRLGDVGFAVLRDSRDSPFATTKGNYFAISQRVFSQPLLSDRSFVKQDVAANTTRPLGGRSSFASSIRIGAAVPFGAGERATVPISESFYLGGDSTLRGFERDELGPGDAMFLVNGELRLPIWKSLRGVVFYDTGNVYESVSDLDPLDLRHVLGLGLRLETPIGPLRLEYGRKLDREAEEKSGELFLAIGSAF